MVKQIIIGFTTEGATDVRFLESIIQRSFESVAFECNGQIEILPIQHIEKISGNFNDAVKNNAKLAMKIGIMVLCVHCDADDTEDTSTFNNKINPAFDNITKLNDNSICNNLVAVVPVAMTEAWMLSNTNLLKDEIGTNKSDAELGIDKHPEKYSNPKACIENAIRIGRKDLAKHRRRDLTISQLYLPIGQKIALSDLENLLSYRRFKESVRTAFRKLNYLR